MSGSSRLTRPWISPGRFRVEQALRLLPEVETLAPLRAALVATSRGGAHAGRYATLGKRVVRLEELRAYGPRALADAAGQTNRLYDAAIEALELELRGSRSDVVRALLRAGASEETAGRYRRAQLWYESALRAAEGLRDRHPEMEALRRIGTLDTARGRWIESIRAHRRSLDLSEAEADADGIAGACLGLGEAQLALTDWPVSAQWFERGLRATGAHPSLMADLHLGLCEARLASQEFAPAEDSLRLAHSLFERLGNADGVVRSLDAWGRLEAARGRWVEALARFHAAIGEMHRAGAKPDLEGRVRLDIGRLRAMEKRWIEAEAEARRAEELAILHDLTTLVVRAYLFLGELRGQEGDETGFVFFEKAIELCRGVEPYPRLEAEVCRAYGVFRRELGDRDEAVAYLTRSREINVALGDGPLLLRLETELAALSSLGTRETRG